MASVNQQSLREELDTVKGELERQCAAGKLAPETRTLIQTLLALLELLMAVFMEKSTPKNSHNSSRPSSQTEKADETAVQPGTHTKGKAEHKGRSRNTRTIETVEIAPVNECACCGSDLSATPCRDHERRTLLDILYEKHQHHVDAEIKQCPECLTINKGAFPAGLAGPLQYGPGIKATVIHFLVAQMVSLKRVQQLMGSLIGQLIAEASLLKFVLQLHHALAAWQQQATEQLLAQPSLHVDETSLRVDRKNHWIHVYSAGEITLKFLHRQRGREAIDAINIIPRYGGVLTHDCLAAYFSYLDCAHSLCGSHLLRELTFVVETNGYAWAAHMKRLLKDTCKAVAQSPTKCLSENDYKNLQKRYRTILTQGAKELPPIPPRQNGKRGRIAKSDAHNLWERLKVREQAVLLFAKLPHVAFTNNRAERDLRMSKVKQKVSGCFRTHRYAEAYCRISSYLQTMANRGYGPLVAIQMALSGEIYAQTGE
jgi:transposase